MARKRKTKSRFLITVTVLLLLFTLLYYKWGHRGSNTVLELPPLPAGFASHGIDISHHQGAIDWELFHTSSDSLLGFVYCKATEGVTHVDSRWDENRKSALSLGIAHGAYHFFLPKSDALAQANHFLAHYKHQQSDLPPVLDAETEAISDTELRKRMLIWLKQVEQVTGKRPVIYTSHHFYRTKFKGKFPGYKFWIANYNKQVGGLDDPDVLIWQYSDHGSVPGIQEKVDMNFSKITY